MMINQKQQIDLCVHQYSFGYCPNHCFKYFSLKQKVVEDRRLFLKAFHQMPRSIKSLLAHPNQRKMKLETKVTFIQKLIAFHKLEKQLKY